MIRDRIIVGIRNVVLLEKLQLKADLTLEEAVTQVRQSEAIKWQQPLLRSGSGREAKYDISVGKDDTHVEGVNRGKAWHRPNYGRSDRHNTILLKLNPGAVKPVPDVANVLPTITSTAQPMT